MGRGAGLRRGPNRWRGGLVGTAIAHLMFGKPIFFQASHHVRAGGAQLLRRVRGDLRAALRHLGDQSVPARGTTTLRRRCLHRRRLLVHLFDLVRQSGRDNRPRRERHLRGHPARRRAGFIGAPESSVARRPRSSSAGWSPRRRPPAAFAFTVSPDIAPKESHEDRVLFACVHNAGHSQMAAASRFNALANPKRRARRLGGHRPGPRVHPRGAGSDAGGRHRSIRKCSRPC